MHCRSGGSLSIVTVDLRVLCQGASHSLGSQCVLCLLGATAKGFPQGGLGLFVCKYSCCLRCENSVLYMAHFVLLA